MDNVFHLYTITNFFYKMWFYHGAIIRDGIVKSEDLQWCHFQIVSIGDRRQGISTPVLPPTGDAVTRPTGQKATHDLYAVSWCQNGDPQNAKNPSYKSRVALKRFF